MKKLRIHYKSKLLVRTLKFMLCKINPRQVNTLTKEKNCILNLIYSAFIHDIMTL